MNSARENILGRIRAALRVTAPAPAVPTGNPVFPPVTDPVAVFARELAAVKGELLADEAALRKFLRSFRLIASSVDLVPGNASVREADLGVTGCECLVAQTGSVIVSTRAAGGRALSVLPPVHLVIARREQIVPDLAAAMALLRQRYDGHWPSQLSLVTGPSRTSDIEKTLVLGAHGPKRLVVFFADSGAV
jgi:L-lactate dehydrogenase complex protein LldG